MNLHLDLSIQKFHKKCKDGILKFLKANWNFLYTGIHKFLSRKKGFRNAKGNFQKPQRVLKSGLFTLDLKIFNFINLRCINTDFYQLCTLICTNIDTSWSRPRFRRNEESPHARISQRLFRVFIRHFAGLIIRRDALKSQRGWSREPSKPFSMNQPSRKSEEKNDRVVFSSSFALFVFPLLAFKGKIKRFLSLSHSLFLSEDLRFDLPGIWCLCLEGNAMRKMTHQRTHTRTHAHNIPPLLSPLKTASIFMETQK